MQIVDRLYGVTMQEPGVSRVVSVNLNGLPPRSCPRSAPPSGRFSGGSQSRTRDRRGMAKRKLPLRAGRRCR